MAVVPCAAAAGATSESSVANVQAMGDLIVLSLAVAAP